MFVILIVLLCCVGFVTMLMASNKKVSDALNGCIVECGEGCSPVLKKLLIDWNGKVKQEYQQVQLCMFNYWNLSHIILYFVLSIMFPTYRLFLFVVGIYWELGEAFLGHNNNLDFVWNGIGLLLGMIVRP